MDPNPTPFPGKNQPTKSKPNRNLTNQSKTTSKETSNSRQNRAFGTVRNTNIQTEKTFSTKVVFWRQPEWNPITRVPIPKPAKHKTKTKKKKKNYYHPSQNHPESRSKPIAVPAEKVLEEEGVSIVNEEKTPVAAVQAPALDRSHPSASAYRSAKICSKCRFDKLETSSYWLGHIKLSESVAKHSVSAAFFMLALESKAEPIKKLRFELRRYLTRNGNLGGQREWREVCVGYGVFEGREFSNN